MVQSARPADCDVVVVGGGVAGLAQMFEDSANDRGVIDQSDGHQITEWSARTASTPAMHRH